MTVEAYAKVNLTLEVYGQRSDGYHVLRSVVAPISLHDTLTLEEADGFSSDTGYPDDLCLKAAKLLDPHRGVRISVVKRIPAGGGLGGGSADAAATLLALNAMRGKGLSVGELADLGAQVGSDVPALVWAQGGGLVWMEGRGERVRPVEDPAPWMPSRHLVLVNPGVSSSTAEVYGACTPREIPANGPVNDLQAPAVRLHPEIGDALAALREAGAEGVLMSGSGSTVFGFAESAERADEIMQKLSNLPPCAVSSRCDILFAHSTTLRE